MAISSRFRRLSSYLVGFLLLGVLGACGPSAPAPPADVVRTLTYFPSDLAQVAHVDVRQMQDDGALTIRTDAGLEVLLFDEAIVSPSASGDDPGMLAFVEEAGIDLAADVHTITMTAPTMGLARTSQAPFVVMKVTMDRAQVAAALLAREAVLSDELTTEDIPVYVLSEGERWDQPHVALLDDAHLLFGVRADVARALSGENGFMPSTGDQALLGHAASGRSAWSVFFAVPNAEELRMEPTRGAARTQESPEEWYRELRQLTSVIQQAGMGLRLTDEAMQAQLTLAAGDDAADVRRVLRGVVSAAQSSGDLSTDQREVLERLRITDQGRFVLVEFAGSTAVLRELLDGL